MTIGLAGKYSWEVVGPESPGHPVHYVGFLEPKNETATSGWETPSYIKMTPWSPFESWNYFLYELRHILRNVRAIVETCASFSPLSVAIVLGYILICAMPFSKVISRGEGLYPLITMFIYAAGYTLFLVQDRYLWVVCLLLLLMGGRLVHTLFGSVFFNATRRTIAMSFFVLSFVAIPLAQLVRDMNVGKRIYTLNKRLEKWCNISGRVASNENWRESLCLSYHMKLKYYGVSRPGISEADLERELRRNTIDYFFVWDEGRDYSRFLSDYEEVAQGKAPGLHVYYLGYDRPGSGDFGPRNCY